ncbi:hypothetical protein Mapa_002359 [Marchantia paleacea]|nr:hypothetical protein Mapa_002359 [Marchantia paleacea]
MDLPSVVVVDQLIHQAWSESFVPKREERKEVILTSTLLSPLDTTSIASIHRRIYVCWIYFEGLAQVWSFFLRSAAYEYIDTCMWIEMRLQGASHYAMWHSWCGDTRIFYHCWRFKDISRPCRQIFCCAGCKTLLSMTSYILLLLDGHVRNTHVLVMVMGYMIHILACFGTCYVLSNHNRPILRHTFWRMFPCWMIHVHG